MLKTLFIVLCNRFEFNCRSFVWNSSCCCFRTSPFFRTIRSTLRIVFATFLTRIWYTLRRSLPFFTTTLFPWSSNCQVGTIWSAFPITPWTLILACPNLTTTVNAFQRWVASRPTCPTIATSHFVFRQGRNTSNKKKHQQQHATSFLKNATNNVKAREIGIYLSI